MSDKKSKIQTLDESVKILSKHIVSEMFRIIESQEDKIGEKATDALCMQVLASYIGNLTYNILTEDLEVSKKDKMEAVFNNFKSLKGQVQEAVAAGFTGAMTRFSGKDTEYYCTINMIPEPVNKQPC